MNTLSGDLKGNRRLRLGLNLQGLTGLDTERGTVDDLTVNENVTVNDELAGLLDGARKASAQDKGIQTHLKQLNQILTGQTGGAASLFEGAAQLRLTDTVLGAQTLLFLQTNSVVGILTAAGTTVLTGAIGTLLEVTDSLGRQGQAEGAGLTHLLTGTIRCHGSSSCFSCHVGVVARHGANSRTSDGPSAKTPGVRWRGQLFYPSVSSTDCESHRAAS